jgi:peptide-methionine (S)-S-oxide reductase
MNPLRLFVSFLVCAWLLSGAARAADAPSAAATGTPAGMATAIFAGGCFWCMEHPFDVLDGVVSTTSGYTGGHVPSPTYEQVSSGTTGHAESVRVIYDPAKIGYDKLLDVYWHNVDPLDAGGQFCDRGNQYRTAIFYTTEEQRQLAEQSKAALESSGQLPKPIVTEIVAATAFYPAEDYHQDYYKTNPFRYKYYRFACGRDRRLEEVWGASTAH